MSVFASGVVLSYEEVQRGSEMACKIINVGKDELDFSDEKIVKECLWLVYSYEDMPDDYCGSGYAIALHSDGRLLEFDLGHCSCFGPTEHMGELDAKLLDKSKLLEASDEVNQGEYDSLYENVKELLLEAK